MKKILLGLCLLVSSAAGATNLWTGTSTCASWQADPAVTLEPAVFADAKVGDNLVFTANLITVGDWAAIQVDQGTTFTASSVYGTHVLQQIEGNQTVEIPITEEVKTELQTYGINITGANFVLTSIDMVTPGAWDGLVWEGTSTCASWAAAPSVIIPGSKFAQAKVGDELVCTVHLIKVGDWAAIQLDHSDYSSYTADDLYGQHVLAQVEGDQTVSIRLTETLLSELQTYGINVTGANFVLTKINVVSAEELDPVDPNLIWEGDCTCANWNATPAVNLPGSKFSAAETGSNLVFTVSVITVGEWSAMQIDRSTYTASTVYGTHELAQTEGEQEIVLPITDEVKAELQDYGINITGANFKLTKIAYAHGGTDGIGAIRANAATDAVYDLNGRRVNNLTRPGLYISSGKKILVK